MGGDMPMPQPSMGDIPPTSMGDQGGMEEPMDGEDPSLDGDEDNDPKKEIQSLAGKLSQELRQYNEEQEQPDTDLNKYVIGMILKQASKDMTQGEKQKIINDLKNGFEDDPSNAEGEPTDEPLGNEPQDDGSMGMEEEQVEPLQEICGSNDSDKRRDKTQISNSKLPKTNPFIANR